MLGYDQDFLGVDFLGVDYQGERFRHDVYWRCGFQHDDGLLLQGQFLDDYVPCALGVLGYGMGSQVYGEQPHAQQPV